MFQPDLVRAAESTSTSSLFMHPRDTDRRPLRTSQNPVRETKQAGADTPRR